MQSLLVAGVEITIGSTIRPTYEKVPGETKTYNAIVEELKPSKTGLDTIILIKLIEGGYRSLLASKVEKIEF